MPLTAQHPAVLQLTRAHTVLLDPTITASSDFSRESLQALIAERRRFYTLAAVGGVVGLVIGTVLRVFVVPGLDIPSNISDISGWLVVAVLTALGTYPAYNRAYTIDQRLTEVAKGPHAVTIGRINGMGLDATDTTRADRLWPVVSGYARVEDSIWELDSLRGVDDVERENVRARLFLEIDELERNAAAANLTLDTSDFREDAKI